MSKNATRIARSTKKALAASRKAADEAKTASRAAQLAKDAEHAAVAAACAAERALSATTQGSVTTTSMARLTAQVESAAEEAVERAKDAMVAEGEGRVADAVADANLASRAAQEAGSLVAAIRVISGKAQAMTSSEQLPEPATTTEAERRASHAQEMERELERSIERMSQYLVTYDGRLIASFARMDDALLLEAELADLDVAHGAASARCEVLDRRGHRHGGYLIAGGKLMSFVYDEEYERRFRRVGRPA